MARAKQIGALLVELRANTAKFGKDMDVASKKASSAGKKIGAALKVGAAAAVAGLIAAVSKTAELGDELNILKQKTDISVETLSALKLGAELTGSSFDGLKTSLIAFTRRSLEASQGMASFKRGFDRMGITVLDVNGNLKGTETLLHEMADAFAASSDAQLKASVAQDLFSEQGRALIPLLSKGSAGIRELTEETRRMGILFTNEAAEAATKFNASIIKLTSQAQGLAFTIGNALIPWMHALVVEWQAIFKTRGQFAAGDPGKHFAQQFAENVALGQHAAAKQVEAFKNRLTNTTRGLVKEIKKGMTDVQKARQKMFLKFFANRDALRALIDNPPFIPASQRRNPFLVEEEELRRLQAQFNVSTMQMARPSLERAFEKLQPVLREATRVARDFAHTLTGGLEDAFLSGQGLRGVLQGILSDLARLAFRATAGGFINTLFTQLGTVLGGAIGLPKTVPVHTGGLQHGGPAQRGRPYIVGERGPELFVPRNSGTVVPNKAMGEIHIHIDARGADAGVEARVFRAMAAFQQFTVRQSVRAGHEAALRSP